LDSLIPAVEDIYIAANVALKRGLYKFFALLGKSSFLKSAYVDMDYF
jgi:hypothetical protein